MSIFYGFCGGIAFMGMLGFAARGHAWLALLEAGLMLLVLWMAKVCR